MNQPDTKQLETLVISLLQDPQDFKRVTKHRPNGVNAFFLTNDKITIEGLFLINKDRIVVSNIKVRENFFTILVPQCLLVELNQLIKNFTIKD